MINDILCGKIQEHLVIDEQSKLLVHHQVQPVLSAMRAEASKHGFQMEMTSAYRGFETQLKIWNAKAQGLRTLYDDNGMALDYNSLTPTEIVYAILRWSALPGASRHHWGTDLDVYDKSRMPEDYKVQLLPQEYEQGGVFGEFNLWLNDNLERFDFFRPYAHDKGGIAPEQWHISYHPVSHQYQAALSFDLIKETIENSEIELKSVILQELPVIYQRFINI